MTKKTIPEAKLMSVNCKLYVLLTTVALLGACDGGISGTGGPMTDGPMSEGPILGSQDPGPAGDMEAPVGEVAVQALDSDITFANNVDATLRSDAIVKIVHTVNNFPPVYALLNQDLENPLIAQPGISLGEGGEFYLSVTPDTHELDVIAASLDNNVLGAPTQIAGINPLSLSAGSASTFVLRGLPDDGSDDPQTYPIEMLAVPNVLSTDSAATVNFRIIHAAPQFDAQGKVDIFIRPADSTNPTAGLVTFEDFDYPIGDSGYFETIAGSYSITATTANEQTQRIPSTDAITPSPGSSTTIIIMDDPDGVAGVDVILMIINDGDRTGLPDL